MAYRTPRRPSWKRNSVRCMRYFQGHCGSCENCLKARLATADLHIRTLIAHGREMAQRLEGIQCSICHNNLLECKCATIAM